MFVLRLFAFCFVSKVTEEAVLGTGPLVYHSAQKETKVKKKLKIIKILIQVFLFRQRRTGGKYCVKFNPKYKFFPISV